MMHFNIYTFCTLVRWELSCRAYPLHPPCRSEWDHEAAQVHTIVFPLDVCTELVAILELSNLCQPPAMRTMRGFNIGYLHM